MADASQNDFREVSDGVLVHKSATLNVEEFIAGKGTVINAHARVMGTSVKMGRECWIDEFATIGGGSAFDPMASLVAGDWLHMGNYSQVNIARGVSVGDEVGIGIGTRIFTHGSYLSEWEGFPVSFEPVNIGSRVWLPNAQVNPGVSIGNDVVVAASSLVTSDLPDGCLAAGIPAKVIKDRIYPVTMGLEKRIHILDRLTKDIRDALEVEVFPSEDSEALVCGDTKFFLRDRVVVGPVSHTTESVRNQLRRHGIRFRFEPSNGEYRQWS
jgi:acetyltransferase-like isoleucine patch superfamily enzyme